MPHKSCCFGSFDRYNCDVLRCKMLVATGAGFGCREVHSHMVQLSLDGNYSTTATVGGSGKRHFPQWHMKILTQKLTDISNNKATFVKFECCPSVFILDKPLQDHISQPHSTECHTPKLESQNLCIFGLLHFGCSQT